MGNVLEGESSFGPVGETFVRVRANIPQRERNSYRNPGWKASTMDRTMGLIGVVAGGTKDAAATIIVLPKKDGNNASMGVYPDVALERVVPGLDFPQDWVPKFKKLYVDAKEFDTATSFMPSSSSSSSRAHVHSPSCRATLISPSLEAKLDEFTTKLNEAIKTQKEHAKRMEAKIDALSHKIDVYYDID